MSLAPALTTPEREVPRGSSFRQPGSSSEREGAGALRPRLLASQLSSPSLRGGSTIAPVGPSRVFRLPSALTLLVALSTTACTFEGYTPKEYEAPPIEIPTVPLALGKTSHNELDCPAGNCQVRFRMEIDRPGELRVSLQPRHSGDDIGIIIVLEDSIGRILDRYNMQDVKPPLIVKGRVQPGPHTVLVQAIGGRLTYDIRAQLRAGGKLEIVERPAARPVQPGAPQARLSYGADSAYDPKVDFAPMRNYAFAQNPEERLKEAAPGESVGNPFFDRQIQLALQREFDERGYVQTDAAQADFLVDLTASGQSTTWYSFGGFIRNEPYEYYLGLWAPGGVLAPRTYQDGRLVIDLIDPKSGDLIWHGWSNEPVNRFDSQKDVIRRFVKAVLDRFPPE